MMEKICADDDVFLAEIAGRSEQIIRAGHPKLYQPALSVADPTDSHLHELIHDMIETMIAAPGVGLAAPQLAVGLRVLTYRIPPGRANAALGEQEIAPRCLINPSFEILSDEIQEGFEGCLSYPNLMGLIPRYRHILCRADLPDGSTWEAECKDFEARILQHEIDHLNGVVFVQRMTDWSKFGFVDEVKAALQFEKQQQESDSV